MIIEVIGVATVLAGLWVLWQGPVAAFWVLSLSALLGAAAAFKLPALGDASVPPVIVVALFLVISVALRPRLREAAIESLAPSGPGFWLLLFTTYAVASAYFMPRLFQGLTHAYSLARNDIDVGIVSLVLMPRASNTTQAAYLIADLGCFMCVRALMIRGQAKAITNALIVCAVLLLVSAVVDVVAYHTDTAFLLSWLRNANYRMLDAGEIGGFKRIVGTFTEAGAFSYVALGFYAFCLSLWLDGFRTRITATLALLLALCLLLSTSTTAYGSFAIFSSLILAGALVKLANGQATRRDCGYLVIFSMIPFLLGTAIMFAPSIWSAMMGLFDATVSSKLESQSGIERMRWNYFAMKNFWDTAGFGAGVGSVRASSFAVALLANTGVLGLLLFVVMLASSFTPGRLLSFDDAVARAGFRACLALIGAACLSAASVDLGFVFFIFFALAASARQLRKREAPQFAASNPAIGARHYQLQGASS
ncbi:hypothetical protein IVA95_32185 [Bradyrhizobium sp. 157]|uniref:hypothetical protein n=1 Tax=Bradyrhizobium sp. 157 TaxID=2782631 RepID=UPI001FF80AFE|nr:hypothetical protein [Bradyrhizobium sp. 157]MCK1642086.1 hypothetical protein [Bradyrhizobium sp. 157]